MVLSLGIYLGQVPFSSSAMADSRTEVYAMLERYSSQQYSSTPLHLGVALAVMLVLPRDVGWMTIRFPSSFLLHSSSVHSDLTTATH
jgi:hypothetical protein